MDSDRAEKLHYEIRVEGVLSADWSDWFAGLTVTPGERGETVIAGPVPDQAALQGILAHLHALGLPLISLRRLPPPDR